MSNTTNAMNTLIRTSALSFHADFIAQHVNVDGHYVSEGINDWRWSSGERILVGVLKVIARGHGDIPLETLYGLDRSNQEAVLLALRIRFGLLDDIGTEAGVR
jgi:hypothetical protein